LLRFTQHREAPTPQLALRVLSSSSTPKQIFVEGAAPALSWSPEKSASGALSFSEIKKPPMLALPLQAIVISSSKRSQLVEVSAAPLALQRERRRRPPQPQTGPRTLYFEEEHTRKPPILQAPGWLPPPGEPVRPSTNNAIFSEEPMGDPYRGGAVAPSVKPEAAPRQEEPAPQQPKEGAFSRFLRRLGLLSLSS
jgi:hypothetical protein